MTGHIHAIDDIDGIDMDDKDDEVEYFDEERCVGCPDYKRCYRKYKLAKALFILAYRLVEIFRRIVAIPLMPFVDAYRKHHGGVQCRFCRHYVVKGGDFCTVCGRDLETGKRLHE